MFVRELRTAFGSERTFEFDPTRSDYWQIRRLLRKLSDGEMSPAEALAIATNAKHPPIFVDEDHPPRGDDDFHEVPFQLVVDWICERNVEAAQRAYAARMITMTEIAPNCMPERWYEGYLKLIHAIAEAAVEVRYRAPADCHVAESLRITDVFLSANGGAYLWHNDPSRSSEVSKVEIRIVRADFRAIWPARNNSEQRRSSTCSAETTAVRRIVEIMRASPEAPISKSELRKQPEFKLLGKNAFNRAFRSAAQATPAPKWLQAGRRPKQRSASTSDSENAPAQDR